ncbi:MAG: calcium/sodium antiporter [Paracoccaceae bacterium]
MDWLMVGLGLAILLLAGDALVKGAVNLALRVGIPALIVSLTVVAFGTSAPELLISVNAILDGAPGIALGNVVGSNTANVLLVLGIPALIAAMPTGGADTRTSYLQMMAATALFIVICGLGTIGAVDGLVLLAALAAMLTWAGLAARRHKAGAVDAEEVEGADEGITWPRILLFLGLGLVGLPLGANLLVDGAVNIATAFGVSETVIGLTLIAIGTSLPELATTVMAAIRRQADVAIGNVIGSNLFNLLGIIGIAALVGPIPVDPLFVTRDLWIMAASSLVLAPFIFLGRDITRIWGAALVALYLAYMVLILA